MRLADSLATAISILLLVVGIGAALRSNTPGGQLLWRLMLVGAMLGGALAQLRYADGQCSWVVGWPFAVTRVQTNCGDVWSTAEHSALARVGDIAVAMAGVWLVGSALRLVQRRGPAREEPPRR